MILDGFKLFCHWLTKSVVHFASKRLIFYASEMCNNEPEENYSNITFCCLCSNLGYLAVWVILPQMADWRLFEFVRSFNLFWIKAKLTLRLV